MSGYELKLIYIFFCFLCGYWDSLLLFYYFFDELIPYCYLLEVLII